MKRILAAVGAALLVMAALAASASADTAICNEDATPCPDTQVQPAGSYVTTGAVGDLSAFRIGPYGNPQMECENNTMSAKSLAASGNPLSAEFDGTLSGCVLSGKVSCTGSMNHPPTQLEASATGGYMRVGTAASPLVISFECAKPGVVVCQYTAAGPIDLNVQGESASTALWNEKGGITSPCSGQPAYLNVDNESYGDYISKYTPVSAFCKVAQEPCASANRYGAGTSLEIVPTSKVTFVLPWMIDPECTSSSLTGQLTGSNTFTISGASFTSCNNGAIVTVEGLPWSGSAGYLPTFGEAKLPVSNVKLRVFRFGLTCYLGGTASASVHNHSDVTFNGTGLQVLAGSGASCGPVGSAAGISGSYGITAPSPFYTSWS